jgi:hypothetical protein
MLLQKRTEIPIFSIAHLLPIRLNDSKTPSSGGGHSANHDDRHSAIILRANRRSESEILSLNYCSKLQLKIKQVNLKNW